MGKQHVVEIASASPSPFKVGVEEVVDGTSGDTKLSKEIGTIGIVDATCISLPS
jgi:hypothetical protein